MGDLDLTQIQGAPAWAVLLWMALQQVVRAVQQRAGSSPEARLERLEKKIDANNRVSSRALRALDRRLDKIELGCPVARGGVCPQEDDDSGR